MPRDGGSTMRSARDGLCTNLVKHSPMAGPRWREESVAVALRIIVESGVACDISQLAGDSHFTRLSYRGMSSAYGLSLILPF